MFGNLRSVRLLAWAMSLILFERLAHAELYDTRSIPNHQDYTVLDSLGLETGVRMDHTLSTYRYVASENALGGIQGNFNASFSHKIDAFIAGAQFRATDGFVWVDSGNWSSTWGYAQASVMVGPYTHSLSLPFGTDGLYASSSANFTPWSQGWLVWIGPVPAWVTASANVSLTVGYDGLAFNEYGQYFNALNGRARISAYVGGSASVTFYAPSFLIPFVSVEVTGSIFVTLVGVGLEMYVNLNPYVCMANLDMLLMGPSGYIGADASLKAGVWPLEVTIATYSWRSPTLNLFSTPLSTRILEIR